MRTTGEASRCSTIGQVHPYNKSSDPVTSMERLPKLQPRRPAENSEMSVQILVVDDDAEQRSDLSAMISSFGYEVVEALDGRDALNRLASSAVSAIVTDLVMPRMDGNSAAITVCSREAKTGSWSDCRRSASATAEK